VVAGNIEDLAATSICASGGPCAAWQAQHGRCRGHHAAAIVSVSPPAGATGVPVNARVVVRASEPIDWSGAPKDAVQVSAGAVSGARSPDH